MRDQANVLRGLVGRRQSLEIDAAAPGTASGRAHSIAITSGKGGVGKSNIALNVSIALAQSGAKVCLLDANLGLGNIDLLCGLNGYWNIAHVVTGARSLGDVVLRGPGGVHVIPGASGLTALADCPAAAQQQIFDQLDELERSHDFLVIDTGAGIHESVRRFVQAADLAVVVTTPEPTAVANAYAMLKVLSESQRQKLNVLVNQAESAAQAHAIVSRLERTSRLFLSSNVSTAGYIPFDASVPAAVFARKPFMIQNRSSPASRAVEQLARRLKHLATSLPESRSFFPRVCEQRLSAAG